VAKAVKSTVVPRLRFPEFRAHEEWDRKLLGEEGEFLSSLTGKSAQHFGVGQAKYITYMNVFSNTFTDIAALGAVEVGADESQNAVEAGDVFFTVSSETPEEVGMSSVLLSSAPDCYLNSFCAMFRFAEKKRPHPRFLGYLLRQPLVRAYFAERAQGSTRFNLSKGAFRSLPIAIPSATEQQKIAECLTSLDEVIAAQGRKVEALKTHKRGLMQQLFPREGETLPRLRFPKFRDGPEWREVRAGTLFTNRSERGDDTLPIYSVTMSDGLVKRASLDRRIDDLAEATGNKKAYPRDIAYNMMRMWQGACGVAHEECMVSPAYVVLSPQMGVNSAFYGYFFKLPQMLRLLTAHSRGLTEDRLRLYYQDFSRIPLPQPDVREQEQIAGCLSAVDTQIVVASNKLAALKTHKGGLMSQLFPSPEKV
jgi:type I restriction enzyme, S subunit